MRCTDQLISYHVEVPVDWYRDDLLYMCVWAPLLRRVTTSEKMLTLKLMLFVIYFGTWKMSKLIEHLKFENLSNEPLKKFVLEIYRCDECHRISRKTDAKSEQFGRSSSTIQARVCTYWDWSVTSMNAVFYIVERIHCLTNSPFCCWSWVNPFIVTDKFPFLLNKMHIYKVCRWRGNCVNEKCWSENHIIHKKFFWGNTEIDWCLPPSTSWSIFQVSIQLI